MRLIEHSFRAGLALAFAVAFGSGCGGNESEPWDAGSDDGFETTDTDPTMDSDSTDPDASHLCDVADLPDKPDDSPRSVRFELNRETGLDGHVFIPTARDLDRGGYGGGGALIDYNRDGLVDVLFVRRAPDGSPTCLYENVSTDTETVFREANCFPELERMNGARVGDFDGDSDPELLVYGDDSLYLIDGPTISAATKIFTRDAFDSPCLMRSVIAHPTDQDAIIIFFGEPDDSTEESIIDICEPLVIREDNGTYLASGTWDQADFKPNVLAVGRSDFDFDGLLDTALAVDTFSNEEKKNTGAHPGGIVRGVLASDPSSAMFIPWFVNSERAWGSFMGINQLLIEARPSTFLSDLGIPLVRADMTGENLESFLPDSATGDPMPYSWSPIVADFNLDQRDDVVLTRGTVLGTYTPNSSEADMFLVQTDGGFIDETASSGLLAHPDAFADESNRRHYSRAGAVTDFDRDGKLELLIMPLEGRPLLYESNLATHCLAELETRYTNPANALYGWAWLDYAGNPHPLRIDGHMRLGQSEWVPLPIGKGIVRAPSGARLPYDCSAGERISLAEPTWAYVAGESVVIDFCAANLDGQLVQHRQTGAETWEPAFSDSQNRATIPMNGGDQELRINGQFALSCVANSGCAR